MYPNRYQFIKRKIIDVEVKVKDGRENMMRYKVLAVDNDPKALLTIKYYIQMTRDDINIIEATSCAEALKIHKSELLHLVITELNLPDGNGQEMVLKMREIDPSLNVIVQTTEADRDYNIQIRRLLRCIDFFVKPYRLEIFEDALNYAIDHDSASRSRRDELLVVQGKSHIRFFVDEILGGTTIKGKPQLLIYIYKFEKREVETVQLDNMTIPRFLEIANEYTNVIVQCQKCFFVNKNWIFQLNAGTPSELVMEFGDIRFPVGKKFMKNVKRGRSIVWMK